MSEVGSFILRPVGKDEYGARAVLGCISNVVPIDHPDIFRIPSMDHVTIALNVPSNWSDVLPSTHTSPLTGVRGTLQELRSLYIPRDGRRSSALQAPVLIGYKLDEPKLKAEMRAVTPHAAPDPHISVLRLKSPELRPLRTTSVDWLRWFIDEQCIPPELTFDLEPVKDKTVIQSQRIHPRQFVQPSLRTSIGNVVDFSGLDLS